MTVSTTPHLNFRGQARAALEHYQRALGGELVVITYADAQAVQDPAEAEQVMWGQVESPSGVRVMAYDVPGSREHDPGTAPFFISVRGDDTEEVARLWRGLAEGATIVQDLGPAGWSPLYGMLRDPYGVTWVLDVAVAQPA